MTSAEDIPARLLRPHSEIWPVKCCEPTEGWHSTFSHRPSRTSNENKRIKSVLHFRLMISYFFFPVLNEWTTTHSIIPCSIQYTLVSMFQYFPYSITNPFFARFHCNHIAFGLFVLIFFSFVVFVTVEVTEVVTKTVYCMLPSISIAKWLTANELQMARTTISICFDLLQLVRKCENSLPLLVSTI